MAFLVKSRTTYDAIHQLLNDVSSAERDRLTERWKSNKVEELNFVGIVVRSMSTKPTRSLTYVPAPPN